MIPETSYTWWSTTGKSLWNPPTLQSLCQSDTPHTVSDKTSIEVVLLNQCWFIAAGSDTYRTELQPQFPHFQTQWQAKKAITWPLDCLHPIFERYCHISKIIANVDITSYRIIMFIWEFHFISKCLYLDFRILINLCTLVLGWPFGDVVDITWKVWYMWA